MKGKKAERTRTSRLAKKTLAVGSGKGGVGKSVTSVNLAVCYAKMGMRTALCDLDPLSDTAVILDIRTPEEQSVTAAAPGFDSPEDFILPVLPRLDLLFPASTPEEGKGEILRDLMFNRFARDLDERYDIIILDMPAGIGREENLEFLPFIDNLVVVTNPEPTSHVSAGGYIRAALDIHPHLTIHLWHNRYRVDPSGTFNTRAVAENYNRFVEGELCIGPEESGFVDAAFVPEDPSLNLLRGSLPVVLPVLYRLDGALDNLNERIVMTAPFDGGMDKVTAKLVRYHVARKRAAGRDASSEAVDYINAFLSGGRQLDRAARESIERFCASVLRDEARTAAVRAMGAFESAAEEILERDRLFSTRFEGIKRGKPDAAAASFMKIFVRSKHYRDRYLRYSAGLVLYYYALYRLLQSKPVSDLFMKLVPVRNEGGSVIRDRRRQIGFLLEKDEL